jgi:hypothetical protein
MRLGGQVHASQQYKGLITIIGDKYEPTEDGLLQGAIDRDLYIIEHNFPHTRNFTDEELLIAIEKRAKGELNVLKGV